MEIAYLNYFSFFSVIALLLQRTLLIATHCNVQKTTLSSSGSVWAGMQPQMALTVICQQVRNIKNT